MMCTIDGDTFYSFTRNTWIRDSGTSCHIINDDTGLFEVTDINELIQGSSSIMPTTNKGKVCFHVCQVNRTEQVHVLCPMKFCPKEGANLFSLMCKLSKGNMISSNHCNNIVVNTTYVDIILDGQIKTHNGFVTGVDFLHETTNERAQSATASCKKNINDLHFELGHPSETIMCATAKALGIQITSTFQLCKDAMCHKQKGCTSFNNFGGRLLFDISSPATPTFGGKWHWLLVIDDSCNYIWSLFLKEKSDLASTLVGLIKNLKNNLHRQYLCCDSA